MKKTYFLLSLTLLASGTALAMENDPAKKPKVGIHGEKPYRCTFEGCNFAAAQKANLIRHIRNHTGEFAYCDYEGCDYGVPHRSMLTEHMRKHYLCQICNNGQTSQLALNNHIQIHPTCVDYPSCNYRAFDTQELNSHLQQHQQQLNNARLLHLLASNTHVQNTFSVQTLLDMNRQ
jgi:hypothetical protein